MFLSIYGSNFLSRSTFHDTFVFSYMIYFTFLQENFNQTKSFLLEKENAMVTVRVISETYNHGQNSLQFFNVLTNFSFARSEMVVIKKIC